MTIRVTQFTNENLAIQAANRHLSDVFRFQQQITSGVRFSRPSEDPIPFRQVQNLTSQFERISIELATIQSTEATLNSSVSQLLSASDIVTTATVALQTAFQTTDQSGRDALAAEIEGALNQLQSIANATFNGEFLYGGTRTDSPPFTFSDPVAAGRSQSVIYNGSTDNGSVLIGDGIFLDNFVNGLDVFGGAGRQPTVLQGDTGARTGTGTDNLTSRANLDVIHGTTTFSGTSGIAIGVASDELDTIIGDHQLTIVDTAGDGSAGTISLNDGPEIPFDGTQTNLEITGPIGQRIFVDTTAITAGFSGTITASADGFLSVDDGASQIPIDFSGNQIVTDSITGRFVNIDSTEITRAGTDSLEFPGTSNAFELLSNVITDLRNPNGLTETELNEQFDRQLGELGALRDSILETVGSQSTSLQTLDEVSFRQETLALQLQTEASEIQGTDFSEAALQLQNSQDLLEFTFAITSSITNIQILDFLR